MKKIILLGYMGSGKSTIGKLLSKSINFSSLDLDKVIEKEQGLTINKIFKQNGELYFRKLEHQVLKKIIASNENYILSLGGGTPCYSNNMELIKDENIISIYLNSSVDQLFLRLNENKSKRPLISNMNEIELKDFIAKHLFERSYYYNQADFTINTNNKSRENIVDEIRMLLF